jgi:hypothetical protein
MSDLHDDKRRQRRGGRSRRNGRADCVADSAASGLLDFLKRNVFGLRPNAGENARETRIKVRGSTLTVEVEIESILSNEELAALLEAAEASGQLRQQDLSELLDPMELDPLELEAVHIELDRRSIELVPEEPEKELTPPPQPAATQSAETTTDALQLFLREAGKHALLTAPQ